MYYMVQVITRKNNYSSSIKIIVIIHLILFIVIHSIVIIIYSIVMIIYMINTLS